MQKILTSLILSLLTVSVFAVQPQNLQIDKEQIKHYVNSGQYSTDIATVTNQAQAYLAKRIQENKQLEHPKKLAIVLDIDETSLSNYNDMVKLNFGGKLKTIVDLEYEGHDNAIKPTLALYNFAKKNNVALFFITGREEIARAKTIKNLNAAGYKDWHGLYLRPDGYLGKSAIPFKSAIRKKLEKQGYDIVFTMGDQQSDLKGGYADKSYLLPNPFYIVP